MNNVGNTISLTGITCHFFACENVQRLDNDLDHEPATLHHKASFQLAQAGFHVPRTPDFAELVADVAVTNRVSRRAFSNVQNVDLHFNQLRPSPGVEVI